MGVEEKPVFKMKAVKELKILDAKQAQNICKYLKLVQTTDICVKQLCNT